MWLEICLASVLERYFVSYPYRACVTGTLFMYRKALRIVGTFGIAAKHRFLQLLYRGVELLGCFCCLRPKTRFQKVRRLALEIFRL